MIRIVSTYSTRNYNLQRETQNNEPRRYPAVQSAGRIQSYPYLNGNDKIHFGGFDVNRYFRKFIQNRKDKFIGKALKEIRRIKLNHHGGDHTIKGYFIRTDVRKFEFEKTMTLSDGKVIELPSKLDSKEECLDFWTKYINPEHKSGKLLTIENAENCKKILRNLPDEVLHRILYTLSAADVNLTAYDHELNGLIKYRRDLYARKIKSTESDTQPTKKCQKIINLVAEHLYSEMVKNQHNIQNKKHLIIMIGQKAAGKTTSVKNAMKKYGVIVGDSDNVRDLPGKYAGGIGRQETELHVLLKYSIKKKLEDIAIANGTNFLAQVHGTGMNKASKIIEKFQKAGYTVEVQNIEVPEEQLIQRIKNRYNSTKKYADPLSVLIWGQKEQKEIFYKLINKYRVNGIRLDNQNKSDYGLPDIIEVIKF